MLLKPDCIPCIQKMSLGLMRALPVDEKQVKTLFNRILQLPSFREVAWRTTPPQVIEPIMIMMQEAVNAPDPFSAIKKKQNDQIAAIYPDLKNWVRTAADPLETAVKMAIIGNAIDFMIAGGPADIKYFVRERLTSPLPTASYLKFRRRLADARSLVYFTDNCGEILMDKLLIHALKDANPTLEIFLVVRSLPALNDATRKDAEAVGLDTLTTIVENGIDGPLPGTILSRCSKQVGDLIRRADWIISKGGGNFDTLSEQINSLNTDITFLLLCKCVPLIQYFDMALHDLILFNVLDSKEKKTGSP